jgi:hypothetical protein
MSKTPFSNKCDILSELWLGYREVAETNEAWQGFFQYNDVALPMSYMIAEGLVEPAADGEAERLIDETWVMLCTYIDIDFAGEYSSLAEVFEASPMPRLEETNE